MPREPRSTSASLNLIGDCIERLEEVEYQYIDQDGLDSLASRLEALVDNAEADQSTQDANDEVYDESGDEEEV
jgi:hypothetical protein